MKKLVSAVLVIVMSAMCLFSVPCAAATTAGDLDRANITSLISLLAENMPDTAAQRAEVFNFMHVYFSTDANLESVITIVESLQSDGTITGDETHNGTTLSSIIAGLNSSLGNSLYTYKEDILLTLDLLLAIPEANRTDALNDFFDAQAAVDNGTSFDPEAELDSDADFQTALDAVYNYFVGSEGDTKLASHGIGPNTVLRLVLALQDQIMLTDTAYGSADFALKSIDSDFAAEVGSNVATHFSSINGNTELTGVAIVNEIINAINDYPATLKANLKTVLGSSAVDLYTKKASTTTDRVTSPSSSYRPNRTPSGGTTTVDTWTTPKAPEAAEAAYIYTDTAEHWAKDYVGALSKRGVLRGYGDGTYLPDVNITREGIAVALTRALGLEEDAKTAAEVDFADSYMISDWAKESVNLMVQRGVFQGYGDNTFMPGKTISREEMIAVIIRLFKTNLTKTELTYTDADAISEWALDYVKQATGLSIVTGYPDGTLKPANSITRGEAAKVLYNFMHYAGLLY